MKKTLNGFVAGNFDVIHPGYIRMFKECYDNCDYFTVLLHSDPSIERPEKLKPILSVDERIEQLLSIRYVDEVLVYSLESDLYELIDSGGFDVRFLGDDYIGKNFTGDDLGVSLHFINRDHGWSTTKFKKIISETL
jgi:glycerol-3-phosphate cytidylyltransferase